MKYVIHLNSEELLKRIDAKLDALVDEIFADSQSIIVEKQIIDEGTLLKSGNIQRAFLEKTIIYSAPYADVIEFGRLPGTMPPSESIRAWVRRKNIAREDPELNRITWSIMQHIKRDGLEPRPFLSPAVELAKQRLRNKK
jgi:hypothetical protein